MAVADQHEVGLGRPLDPGLAIGERRVDVGAAAELHAEQHLDRIGELFGQVEDGGVEARKLRLDHRQRRHHGGEDRRIDHRGRHRARLVDAQDDAVSSRR
jgi:hypothetical protein